MRLPGTPSKASARSPAPPPSSPIWRVNFSPWSGNFARDISTWPLCRVRRQRSEKAHRLGGAVRDRACITRSVLSWSRSSRPGSSTIASPIDWARARTAVEAYERYRGRHAHVLRCDIYLCSTMPPIYRGHLKRLKVTDRLVPEDQHPRVD